MKRYALLLGLILPGFLAAAAPGGKLPYTYVRVGSPTDAITTPTPGTVLMGGGTDVDEAFVWMSARSGNGDFLVIRATGTDAYNPYIHALCPRANSVATLIIPTNAAANDARVAAIIRQAEAIFIAGGDQSNYLNFWKGTGVQAALNERIAQGVPVGGTSAGMNVLSQFIYAALAAQGVTSSQALADPFNKYMSFDRNFATVPHLDGVLADPHFATRDRMGRDLAFMGRIWLNGWTSQPRSICVDEHAALLLDGTGAGTLAGTGTAYFLKAFAGPEICAPRTPLTYRNVNVYRIGPGATFNVVTWTGAGGTAYTVSATAGVLSSTQAGGSPY